MEFKKTVSITATQKLIDFGNLSIEKDYKTLEGVVITSESPIVIKNDTVQFNASGFKTLPNATAEDLLKKIPGMDVDKEGNIKAQGESVQKVLVDGKEFFGNDPKLATKNLTADMIESVQVFDDMSDQAKFTKIDDGSRSKTINIKLKKDRNKGYFGRALLGVGDGRYEGNLSVNRFNGSKRISLLFNTNNINKQGFSFSDVISAMGGFSGFGGGGGNNFGGGAMQMAGGRGGFGGGGTGSTGLIKSLSTGLNYSDEWGSKIKVTASYFLSNSDTRQEQSILWTNWVKKQYPIIKIKTIGLTCGLNTRLILLILFYIHPPLPYNIRRISVTTLRSAFLKTPLPSTWLLLQKAEIPMTETALTWGIIFCSVTSLVKQDVRLLSAGTTQWVTAKATG